MPRPIRVFVEYRGELRRAFSLAVSNQDASVYIQPSAAQGVFHYGRAAFPAGASSFTFNYKGKLTASQEPHISLHQSGQVHIRTRRGPKTGPLRIPSLSELRGQHVATIGAVTFRGFPQYLGDRGNLDAEFDRIVVAEGSVESGRLAIYLNGERPGFRAPDERIAFTVTIRNASLARPLFLGVATWSQLPLGEEEGVIAIAGFDPDGRGDDFLYLSGL